MRTVQVLKTRTSSGRLPDIGEDLHDCISPALQCHGGVCRQEPLQLTCAVSS